MAETSEIGWTHSTYNPWIGCDKVSEECENCYMFLWAKWRGRDPEKVVKASKHTFRAPLRWQKALSDGERRRVFTCSLSDWFHRDADPWRDEAWAIVRACDRLDFQILTKRHGRIRHHLPADWGAGYANVQLGVSVGSEEWVRRATTLNNVPARVRFLSMEPLITRVPSDVLRPVLRDGIGWVIVGGESGGREKVRPFHEAWALEIVDACVAEGVPVFVKQLGAVTIPLEGGVRFVSKPELTALRPELDIRQFPEVKA